MPNEPGFRRRIWEALHPDREWSEGVDDSEDRLVRGVTEKMDGLKWAYDKKAEAEEEVRGLKGDVADIKVTLWEHDDAPERPMGVKNHHITSEIRRLQAASLGSKKKAARKWADELLKALNHAGEVEEEIRDIEVELRNLCIQLGVKQPSVVPLGGKEAELVYGEKWIRRDLLSGLGMRMRGLLSDIEYAKVGQQIWNEMFAQLRDVAINYAPVVAHCQSAEHIYELCRSPERFKLEVERRVHRPSEAIGIQRSVSHIYTTDAAERKRQEEQDGEGDEKQG